MIPYRIFAQSVFVKILSMLFLGNSTISQTSSKIKISYQMIQGILTVVNNYKENIRKLISTLYRISVETLSAGEVVRYLQEVPLYLQGEYIKRYKTVMFMGRNKKMLCGSA
jgi:predicted PurR-regulated permease PerM